MTKVNKVEVYISTENNPYINLAVEEYLFTKVRKGFMILFLWQNESAVIIGRNQNPYFECNVEYVKENGIAVVRRNTGGGAVYHDLGNLNYSIIQNGEDISRETVCKKIMDAINSLGIRAIRDGRNDILVDGKKISGMAFLRKGSHYLYHGCVMVSVDIEEMTKCLNVSAEKFSGKKITSVKSRVVNLSKLNENIDIAVLKDAIIKEFGGKPPYISVNKDAIDIANKNGFQEILDKYKNPDWNWGVQHEMTMTIKEHFDWGNIQLMVKTEKNRISEVMINSDSLETDTFYCLKKELKGSGFKKADIIACIHRTSGDENILNDVCTMIEKEPQII